MIESALPLLSVAIAGASIALAAITTQRVSRYGPAGMTASMAAMMAAMGTGLSVGYAAGMGWDLAAATLAGVTAGFGHGLWMGRRYGPMAALEGVGGGAMGGLMGPMLSVMLIALPLGLAWIGLLMLALQWAFSAGAIYLVAAGSGHAPTKGPLAWVGWLLGQHLVPAETIEDPSEPVPAPEPPEHRRSRGRRRAPDVRMSTRRSAAGPIIAVVGVASVAAAYAAQSATRAAAPLDDSPPVVAPVGGDGVQDVQLTLRAPYYGPSIVEVKRGVPARVTLTAVGEPG